MAVALQETAKSLAPKKTKRQADQLSNDGAPPEKPNKAAPAEKPKEAAPADKPKEAAPADKPKEAAPADKPADKPKEAAAAEKPAAPAEKPKEAAPAEKPAAPAEKPKEAAPAEKPADKPEAAAAEKPAEPAARTDKPKEAAPADKPKQTTPADKAMEPAAAEKPKQADPAEHAATAEKPVDTTGATEPTSHAVKSKPEGDGDAKAKKKAAKARVAFVRSAVGDLEAMTLFELLVAANRKYRVQCDVAGKRLKMQKYAPDDERQQVVFSDAGDGYVNIVCWSDAGTVYTVNDEDVLEQAPLDSDNARQTFELVPLTDSTFALAPLSHPGHFVEAQLDAKSKVLKLVPEDTATEWSEFMIQEPPVAPDP